MTTKTRDPMADLGHGFSPDDASLVPAISREPKPKGKLKTINRKLDLTDGRVEAQWDFTEDYETGLHRTIILHDFGHVRSVPGLRCRLGPRSATWIFYRDVLDHGERQITSKTLGHFPRMNTDAARKAAEVIAGRLSGGVFEPSRDKAKKFADAFADYLDYLEAKAKDDGKDFPDGTSRWSRNVRRLGKSVLLPKWGQWSLLDMSKRRADVAEWHKKIVKLKLTGVTSANHAVRIIRAIYLREARKDDSLPGDPTKLPSAAVTMRREQWQKQNEKDKPGLAFGDFPKWLTAWRQLSPLRRAYHLTALLTGARPGELARTPWDNLDLKAYTLTVGNSKTGNDIPIPLSPVIERALEMAREAQPKHNRSNLIFPECEQAGHRDPLPARGHAMRRTWKTVAVECGVPDELSALMLGHVPEGLSQKYILRRMLTEGQTMRAKQAAISNRIIELLGSDPTRSELGSDPGRHPSKTRPH